MKKSVHPKLSEQAHKILSERAKQEHRGIQNLCEYILEGAAIRWQLEQKGAKK